MLIVVGADVTVDTATRLRAIPSGLASELTESAWNHGYRRAKGQADGWCFFASDINVPGEIALAVATDGAAWFLSIDHAGVAAELDALRAAPVPQGMRAAFGFADQAALRQALHRAYALATSLPTLPLYEFEAAVAGLGDTEADRMTRVRIGQNHFRTALMRYWDGCCPLTGVAEPALLRASHIVPWAICSSDAERLDVHNGLLLSAHWDAAFDAGLVSFADDGTALFSSTLAAPERQLLRYITPLSLTEDHRSRMAWHRDYFGF